MSTGSQTIAQALQAATQRLAEAGLATPRLDAEVLLRHILDVDRTALFMRYPEPIADDAAVVFDGLLERRLAGQPVAYLVGRREFLGLTFEVTPHVLVPRPETELLVEWAAAWIARHPEARRVIDVGTGSGAIPLGLASLLPVNWDGDVAAVDISPDALAVATANRDRFRAEMGESFGRVSFALSDLLSDVSGPIDLVLANLPYLRPEQVDENPDLAAEPRLALDGGPDGLDLIRRLIDDLPRVLTSTGAVALELDPSQAEAVAQLLRNAEPKATVTIHNDLAGLARFVTAERS